MSHWLTKTLAVYFYSIPDSNTRTSGIAILLCEEVLYFMGYKSAVVANYTSACLS